MNTPGGWRHCQFGLIVTGHGEADFLPDLLGPIGSTGRASFKVIYRAEQREARQQKHLLRMVGEGKLIPDRDQRVGLKARWFIGGAGDGNTRYVLWVDDLEHERCANAEAVFRRYRDVLDHMLGANRDHAAVHFLVMMLEAYYFADPSAVNDVLGTDLDEPSADVEGIRNPKGELKGLYSGFDEVEHGREIVKRLNLEHVLSNPDWCASLRTLVKWCVTAIGDPIDDRFQLANGRTFDVTAGQVPAVP